MLYKCMRILRFYAELWSFILWSCGPTINNLGKSKMPSMTISEKHTAPEACSKDSPGLCTLWSSSIVSLVKIIYGPGQYGAKP